MPTTPPPSSFVYDVSLLLQALFLLALNSITPRLWAYDPKQVAVLTDLVPRLINKIIGEMPAAFTAEMTALNNSLVSLSKTDLGKLGADGATIWHGVLKDIFSAYRADLRANATTDPAGVDDVISSALQRASYLGVGSRMVTVLFETFLPKKLNFMNWLGPTLAQLSGYDEIVARSRAPQYHHAFGNLAEYNAAQTFRTRAPEGDEAEELAVRGVITPAQYRKLIGWSGLMTEFEEAKLLAAHRPVSVRALSTAFVDVNFPEDQVRDMMRFTGNRDVDIDVMVEAFKEKSVANLRAQYLSAMVRSTELGTMTTADLDAELTRLKFSDEARNLIQLTVATRKLEQLAELYRKSVSEGYKYGTISDAQYVPALEAIGIGEADANAHYAVDSIAKNGRIIQAALKDEQRLEAARTRAAIAAAVAEFRAGDPGEAELLGKLLAAGVDPAIATMIVGAQVARALGSQVILYGVTLPRADAVVLRENVAAVEAQYKKQLINDAQARTALENLGLPERNLTPMLATWAALKVATGKYAEKLPR